MLGFQQLHFHQDDHPILFYSVAHVKASTYHFQITLQNTRVMLHKVVRSHGLPFENLVVQSYPQMQFFLMY
jgi:hypothetical protein